MCKLFYIRKYRVNITKAPGKPEALKSDLFTEQENH